MASQQHTSTSCASASPEDSTFTEEPRLRAHDLGAHITLLASERDGLVAKLQEQMTWNEQLEKHLQQQEEDAAKLKDRVVKLRSILTAGARDQDEPLDDTLVQSFRGLRDSVFRIVQRYYRHPPDFCLDLDSEEYPRQAKWFLDHHIRRKLIKRVGCEPWSTTSWMSIS